MTGNINLPTLTHYKDGAPTDVAYLSLDEYRKTIATLKTLPLEDYPEGENEGYYTLEVKLKDKAEGTYGAPIYMAVIDGEDAFEFLRDVLEQHKNME